jgi:uncharacterized alpha-E superfamily protein
MALLSRVATLLYVLGRDLERTEHLARLLRVQSELSLDRSLLRGRRFWPDFLGLAGWVAPASCSREHAIELALGDPSGPSLRRSMESVRSAARAVRPSLSIEVWEQVNSLYWRLQEAGWRGDLYEYLHEIELGTQLIGGLVDDTMAHDEAWAFVKLGKYLERATNLTSIITRKSRELVRHRDDPVAWASVLRCCAAFEAFRLRFEAPVSGDTVARFVLLDRASPRSVAFCIGLALAAVRHVEGPGGQSAPLRLIGQLSAMFEYADPWTVGAAPGDFGVQFDRALLGLHGALREVYFQPNRLALNVQREELSRQPQQQQQVGR